MGTAQFQRNASRWTHRDRDPHWKSGPAAEELERVVGRHHVRRRRARDLSGGSLLAVESNADDRCCRKIWALSGTGCGGSRVPAPQRRTSDPGDRDYSAELQISRARYRDYDAAKSELAGARKTQSHANAHF